jgi:two-component system phosphate regulon sensor histidine kinase PhoR
VSPIGREFVLTVVFFALAGAVGWFVGDPLAALLAVATLFLVRFWVALARSRRVLEGDSSTPSLSGPLTPFVEEILLLRSAASEEGASANRLAVPTLRRFLEILPDALVVLDADFRIEAFNDEAVRLLGLDPERDRGQRIDLLLRHPDFLHRLREQPDGTPVEFHPGGAENRPLRVWILPFDEDHRLLLVRSVRRERLKHEQERLFLSNASHELRTPVTVLFGHLELLRDHPKLPAALRPSVEAMHRESERMNHLLRNLLELLRLDAAASRPPTPAPVAVATLFSTLAERAEGRGRLVVSDPAAAEDRILGQEFELTTAFWNLVDNAFKFGGPESEVRISWSRDEDGAWFEVADDGPGIAPEDLPRVGERFYRAASARAAGVEGSGLGLAIVTAILERHGASLEIDSELGRGTRVRCRFPARALVRGDPVRNEKGAAASGVLQ